MCTVMLFILIKSYGYLVLINDCLGHLSLAHLPFFYTFADFYLRRQVVLLLWVAKISEKQELMTDNARFS